MSINNDMTEDTTDALAMLNYESVPVQGKIEGFTPLMDVIAEEHGIVCAAVFGKVWRYCQMKDGVCRASTETIADGLGVDRSTVSRHLELLCEKKYLKDLTPDLRNRPHIYADTGLIRVMVNITTVAQNTVTVAQNTVTVAQNTVTVAQSRMSKDIKKDSKTLAGKPTRERTPLEIELADIQKTFSLVSGLPEPTPNSDKEKRAAAELWYQPIRRIQKACNGTSKQVVEAAIRQMRKDRLTIAAPKSIEKVAMSLHAEQQTAQPSAIKYI